LTWLAVQGCLNDNPAAYKAVTTNAHPHGQHDDDDGTADDDLVSGDLPSDDDATRDVPPSNSSDDDVTMGDDVPTEPEASIADGGSGKNDGDSEAPASDDDSMDPGTGGQGPAPLSTVDPSSPYYPPCSLGTTVSGEEIKKGTFCTSGDPELCYRECGPLQIGWKSETCLAGVYAEGDCTFPEDGDYSCFAIPDAIDTAVCPTDSPPKSLDECDIPECTLCNLNGQYFDTASNAKEGYCVCREPDENGVRTWTCASTTAWPCPFSRGC
jgi:hypothetical protein